MARLNSVLKNAKACTICKQHLPLGPRPVFQLHRDARVLICGQAPGRKVHESGVPFDDASGNRLREWMGINRETFYDEKKIAILPMGFCYPGTGKSGDLPPRPECAETWHEQILASMTNVELKLIIGKYAIDYHLGKSKQNLTEIVRAWNDHLPDKVVLPHPSPRNNIWFKKNPWFEKDLLSELRNQVSQALSI